MAKGFHGNKVSLLTLLSHGYLFYVFMYFYYEITRGLLIAFSLFLCIIPVKSTPLASHDYSLTSSVKI